MCVCAVAGSHTATHRAASPRAGLIRCPGAGVIHLLFNMMAVWRIGKSLEEDFGLLRIGTLYLVSGLVGNVASATFLPLQITVGDRDLT